MVRNRHLMRWFSATLLTLVVVAKSGAAQGPAACSLDSACESSCTRFDTGDVRRTACNNFCRKGSPCTAGIPSDTATPANEPVPQAETVSSPETAPTAKAASSPEATPAEATPSAEVSPTVEATPSAEAAPFDVAPAVEAAPKPESLPPVATSTSGEAVRTQSPDVPKLTSKSAVVKEHDQNLEMLSAIRAGNLKVIRRLIEVYGLNPTYVFTHEFNQQTRQYDGRILGFRLTDIFGDTSTLRTGSVGLDSVLSLFLELEMDVKATLPANVAASDASAGVTARKERRAWGPSLRMMEPTKDRAARMQAFEIALQAGLLPNDDFSAWLFAELPQVCGRDRSKFSIQVVDLLIKYLVPAMGPEFAESFWRAGKSGPETIADVLDRSFAPGGPKNSYEKEQFALQDNIWEQCAPLSRRINRFLIQGT
jgi:hypothetical protein